MSPFHSSTNFEEPNRRYRYPIVYSFSILPLSIVRWIDFVQERNGGEVSTNSAATFACISIHVLSGVCNVLLLLKTRPNTPLFGRYHDSVALAPLPDTNGEHGHHVDLDSPTVPRLHSIKERSETIQSDGSVNEMSRLPSR